MLARRLWAEFREQARPSLLIPGTLIAMSLTLTRVLRAYLTGRLLDLALQGSSATLADFSPLMTAYFGAALYEYGASVVEGILFALARWNMSMAMRQKLFRSLLRQEVAFFEANQSGALVSRLTNDTDQMQSVLNRTPETLVTNVLRCIASIFMMAQQHGVLTAVSIFPLPLALLLVRRTGKIVGKFGVMQNDALAQVNAVANEAVANARAVQLAGAEQTENRAYAYAIGKYLDVIRQTLFKETALRFVSSLVNDACTDVPLMCMCCLLIAQGQITVGQFYTYRSLLFGYRRGFRELADLFTGLSRAQAVSKRYFEIADREPKVKSRAVAERLDPQDVRGTLRVDGVSFRYPGSNSEWALREVSIDALPGEMVALVGASGAGKSTLLKICSRLMDPDVGTVRLDDRDIRDINLYDLRRCLGVMDQDPSLFNRSVTSNILYGVEDPIPGTVAELNPQNRASAAALAARADGFLQGLPDGYESSLGERGSRLSGGQRQRVALARVLARDAQVYLLDEPTSALDGESEEGIATLLRQLADQGRTVVVSAHRVGTVARADRLVVLEHGRVVEQGRREDLLAMPTSRYKTVVEPGLRF